MERDDLPFGDPGMSGDIAQIGSVFAAVADRDFDKATRCRRCLIKMIEELQEMVAEMVIWRSDTGGSNEQRIVVDGDRGIRRDDIDDTINRGRLYSGNCGHHTAMNLRRNLIAETDDESGIAEWEDLHAGVGKALRSLRIGAMRATICQLPTNPR
jgi:hypothetical protein